MRPFDILGAVSAVKRLETEQDIVSNRANPVGKGDPEILPCRDTGAGIYSQLSPTGLLF